MLFQISDGQIGFSLGQTNYNLKDTDSITYTFSQKNNLTRGASGENKIGIPVKEGLKEGDMADVRVVDCDKNVYKLLDSCFLNQTRISLWFIDKKTGGGLTFKDAIITDKPLQTEIAEGIDSLHFILKVKSFNVELKIK